MREACLIGAFTAALCGCQQVLLPPAHTDLAPVAVEGGNHRAADVVGYNCSVARWAIGKSYCKPIEAPPRPQYCTRSLARVDCWDRPDPFGYHQRQVADGPWQLTPEQHWNSRLFWPFR